MEKRKICFYVRNSTQQQDFQYQIDNLTAHLNRFNDVQLIHVFSEKISGFLNEKERPEMNNLLKFAASGGCSEIWVNDFARLSRDAVNLQNIVSECTELNVNIFFHSNNLYSLDNNGEQNLTSRLIISNLAIFAEMDAKGLKMKGVQGKISKTKQGNYVGGILPIGYTYINDVVAKTKKIVIDSKEKKVVEYIFNAFVNERKSLSKICNGLNSLKEIDSDYQPKLKTADNNFMYYTSVIRSIILCTWYAKGERTWKDEIIKLDDSLKFIEMTDYNTALTLLKENVRKEKPSKHQYILNEKMFCSCGSKMLPKTTKIINSYVCKVIHNRKLNKSINCSNGKSINIEQSENAVWNLIKNKISDFKIEVGQKNNREAEIRKEIEHNNQLIDSIKDNTIVGLKEARKRTIHSFNRFGGDDTEFENSIKQIDNQIRQQETHINELLSVNTKLQFSIENLDVANEIEQHIKEIENDKNLIKLYVNRLVDKITVADGLNGEWKSLLIIEWNKNINSNCNTFIFYKFFGKKQMYYYINEIIGVSVIVWCSDKKLFRILDIKRKKSYCLTIEELINHYDRFYNSEFDEFEMDVNLAMVTKENYALFSKDYSIFNIIIGNCARLEIVTPFI